MKIHFQIWAFLCHNSPLLSHSKFGQSIYSALNSTKYIEIEWADFINIWTRILLIFQRVNCLILHVNSISFLNLIENSFLSFNRIEFKQWAAKVLYTVFRGCRNLFFWRVGNWTMHFRSKIDRHCKRTYFNRATLS